MNISTTVAQIFPVAVLILLVLISILTIILVGAFAWLQYMKGAFFCRLPLNHTALIEIDGKPLHWLMHSQDKDLTIMALVEMVRKGIIEGSQKKIIEDKIVCRSKGIWGLFVSWFNVHMTSLNPFATIKPVEVIRTGLKDSVPSDTNLVEHMKVARKTQEKFLRLAWPRTLLISDIELMDQVQITLIAIGTKLRVWNLPQIWYELDGKISEKVDEVLSSMFVQHLGNKELNAFQTENMTARRDSGSLHDALQNKGLEAIGVWLEGPIAVYDWELGKDQERVRLANLAHAAAQAEKKVTITEAEGRAESAMIEGMAAANVTELKGSAFAEANKKLVEAYGGDSKSASNVAVAQELSKPGSNVRVIGGSAILNLNE